MIRKTTTVLITIATGLLLNSAVYATDATTSQPAATAATGTTNTSTTTQPTTKNVTKKDLKNEPAKKDSSIADKIKNLLPHKDKDKDNTEKK